ncbi:MAG: hypothetical protein OSB70_19680, partial [Myxococcota bacterium]|nr:hypothetical protein [Myxococcota bacterium]
LCGWFEALARAVQDSRELKRKLSGCRVLVASTIATSGKKQRDPSILATRTTRGSSPDRI